MKKEEILEASRRENKNRDVYEAEVGIKATRIGALLAVILTTVYYCYEIISGKGENPALYSIITIFCSGSFAYKAMKVEKNRKLNIFTSTIWGILTIMLIINYFTGK